MFSGFLVAGQCAHRHVRLVFPLSGGRVRTFDIQELTFDVLTAFVRKSMQFPSRE